MLNKKALTGTASAPPVFVEDVFSTYLWTGNGTTQSITNGIDLAGKGGMVWRKQRDATADHFIADTVRGTYSTLSSNTSSAASGSSYIDFLSDGFQAVNSASSNSNGSSQCSWTFREQAKFFDVVTYTGTGSARTVAHNLGSVPGMMLVKRTSGTSQDWNVYHRSLGNTFRLLLNSTAEAFDIGDVCWNATTPTSSVFSLGTNTGVNASGETYVAYLFAHNAGGFGTAGTDNVISCGSFTTDGSGNATANLGYEPQYILIKSTSSASNWWVLDTMRNLTANSSSSSFLVANDSGAEVASNGWAINATGFNIVNFGSSRTFIYMAIRRPMKVPTTGTSVFKPVARTGTDSSVTIDAGFTVDMNIASSRNKAIQSNTPVIDRLRGGGINYRYLNTQEAVSETTGTASGAYELTQNGVYTYNTAFNSSSETYVHWMFKRAPGFFDIVCYTGTGSNRTVAHNLGVAPEFLICKSRNGGSGREWIIYASGLGNTKALQFNNSGPSTDIGYWNNTTPGSSTFTLGTEPFSNTSNELYVAYLFATCPGVSKVGSYTGDGTDGRVINCGFTGGARFVLIKVTNTTGNWRVWDTARGIVTGNDPFLALNNTSAEVTNSDDIDPSSSGFIVNYNGNSAINESGWTYIFLAIA
jgi:hypothetical protein